MAQLILRYKLTDSLDMRIWIRIFRCDLNVISLVHRS